MKGYFNFNINTCQNRYVTYIVQMVQTNLGHKLVRYYFVTITGTIGFFYLISILQLLLVLSVNNNKLPFTDVNIDQF